MAKFELKALITGVDKLSPQLTGIRKKIAGFQKGVNKAGFGKLGFSDLITGGALAAPFIAGSKAAIDFESQMADVNKVLNLDDSGIKAMGNAIVDMSKRLPMAASDIAKIVAAAGQAGIARNELARFAEDAVKMGVAFDTTAEESGEMMKIWRTSFKMTQDEVVTLADKINYLGNTGAKTKDVADMVTRIGSLGQVAGVSAGELSAMAATLSKVGVKTDVGATGLKNFMLALTQGSAATKKQQLAFKALRLDARQLAEGMQTDAKGTILDVLNRLKLIDASKRPAILTQIFGKESIEAISPLLDSLDVLKTNLQAVGDKSKYNNSMLNEFKTRAATTANNIQLLKNQLKAAAINLGSIFLPAINDAVSTMSPFIGFIGDFIRNNPQFVKTIAIMGVAFVGMKLAIFGVTKALAIMSAVMKMSPLGIFLRAAALAAGLIIANWDTVGPFFIGLSKVVGGALGDMANFVRGLFGLDPVDWEKMWGNMGVMLDDLRAKTVLLYEEFDKFKKAAATYVPFKNKVAKWVTGIDADEIDRQVANGEGIYANTIPYTAAQQARFNARQTTPLITPAASIVNPQSQKLNGVLEINFNNAPSGMRVDQAKTDQPLILKTKQNVGTRDMRNG